VRGDTKSLVAMSLLVSPSTTSHDVALGGGQRCPAAGGSFAFAAAALRVGDRVLGGHGGALSPRCLEVFVAHGVTKCRHRGFVVGVPDLEPDRAHTVPDGLRCAKEARGFGVTAGLTSQIGEDLEDVGNKEVRLEMSDARESIVVLAHPALSERARAP